MYGRLFLLPGYATLLSPTITAPLEVCLPHLIAGCDIALSPVIRRQRSVTIKPVANVEKFYFSTV